MNGIKIRFEIDGSKYEYDGGVHTAVVCTYKQYDFLDAQAMEDVRRAIVEMCKENRYKGWRIGNFKLKSIEVA